MGNLLTGVTFKEPTTVEECDSTWDTDSGGEEEQGEDDEEAEKEDRAEADEADSEVTASGGAETGSQVHVRYALLITPCVLHAHSLSLLACCNSLLCMGTQTQPVVIPHCCQLYIRITTVL